jgi:hypothetical protein
MKRFRLPGALLVVAASFALAATTLANAPLSTFGDGDVTVSGDSATIHLEGVEYGGVYIHARAMGNKAIGNVEASFVSTGDVAGGAPRLNVPVDNDGDKMWDYWAVLDAANCGGTSGQTVQVSTENSACAVFFLGADAPAAGTYANWDAYAAANAAHRVASKGDDSTPFIIADGTPGDYAIEAVNLQ